MVDKAREVTLKILYKIDKEKAYSNIELNKQINQNKNSLNEKDIGLISEIVYGVTTWKLTLDEIIKKHSKLKLKKLSIWIINILRMGIYQIVFLDKIPKSASVNESVNLAKKYGHTSSSGYVNAILRKVEKSDYEELFEIKNEKEKISKTTSMPIWIVEELAKTYNIKEVEKICQNSNIRPNLIIRINKLKTTKDNLIKKLQQKNIKCESIGKIEVTEELSTEDFLILKNVHNLENLQEFKEGLLTVQDVSAGLTARLLNPKKKENILDACSAPGGKTTYIAELMENQGKIEAWDVYEHRTKLVEENAKRLGINIINTKVKDASIFDNNLQEKYDKILLDVPCMGIGVIKRKPDIKWQRRPENIKEITEIQLKILENCFKYLKKGGTLVYSTCSILKEENEDIINKFLDKTNGNFKKENTQNKQLKAEKEKIINLLPNEENDGFFMCKIHKK